MRRFRFNRWGFIRHRFVQLSCCGITVLLAGLAPAFAQSSANVLVVINDASDASVRVGEYYAKARGIPSEQVVRIRATVDESIARLDYVRDIESPIGRWIGRHALHDRILYVVLTKGLPIRISGTAGRDGTIASVDSELTLLYRRMLDETVPALGREDNPYFLGSRPLEDARKFTRFDQAIYLVTRLDGYTVDDVLHLIDRGLKPSVDGTIVLDQRATSGDVGGEQWLYEASTRLAQGRAGGRAVLESTREVATVEGPVLGYYSWGSNDPANQRRGSGLTFANGALAGMFVSTDGRTFQEPPADWKPGASNRPFAQLGSGSQSLAGDLIREGVTGVSANVSEPYLDGVVRPDILFPAYVAGFNLAEAYYLALPSLSWQTMIIGDPLVAPFRPAALRPEDLHRDLDAETELPALFSERRLKLLAAQGLRLSALKLVLRADAYLARQDEAGAEALMVKAVDLEPRLITTAARLGQIHDARGEYEQARARYEAILKVDPDHTIALNNLAYSLAVHAGRPKDALPLAERAFRRSNLAVVADTVGWIYHLLGDSRAAISYLERAAASAPNVAEFQFHAAVVHAALGQLARARTELATALKIEPTLSERDDVKALELQLTGR